MMGSHSSKISNLTIEGDSSAGGKWCLFKSPRVGLLTVRNYGTDSSVLNLWAPPDGIGHSIDGKNREATLSLVRANNSEKESEFIDIYNQDYASCGRESGIRIQKRGETTSYPQFKIEFSDGVNLHEAMKFIPPKDSGSDPSIAIKSHVSLSGKSISGLALPINEQDAANKVYVDQKIPQCSIYKLEQQRFTLTPVVENSFFTIATCEPGIWCNKLKSGIYKLNLNFVISNQPDEKDPNFVVLKLDNKTLLCQKLKNSQYESNSVCCVLDACQDSDCLIQFTRTAENFPEMGLAYNGLQKSSFLLQITQLA